MITFYFPNIKFAIQYLVQISRPVLVRFCILEILSFQCLIMVSLFKDILTKIKFSPHGSNKMDNSREVRGTQAAFAPKAVLQL